jgi:TonB family protein
MIAWMLQCVVVSVLLTLAAMAAERLLRMWYKEARLAWAVAMGASLALSLIGLAQRAGWIPSFRLAASIAELPPAPFATLLTPVRVSAGLSHIDAAIGVMWLLATLGLTIRFLLAARTLRRRRVTWRPGVVDGQRLFVSSDAGPAVVGFRNPAVVIPEWVLGLEHHLRALVLRHEREHLEQHDPRLLLGAVMAATVAPWNPIAWFQLYRLRSAMELDCDRRVLRAYPDAYRYGSLLLAVAQRADRAELLQAALTESNSLLARRITAMRNRMTSFRVTQTALLATSAILAGFVACELQSPTQPPQVGVARLTPTVAQGPYFEFQVEQAVTPAPGGLQPRYPDMLRRAGVEGEVLAQFIVGPDGRPDPGSFRVLKSSHDLFTNSVRAALPEMSFNAARVGGRAVRQVVQQPFTFSITK